MVDGIRHQSVLQMMRTLVRPLPFYLLYLTLPEERHEERLALKRISDMNELREIESHPAEREVVSILRRQADWEMNSDQPLGTVVDEIVKLIPAVQSKTEDPFLTEPKHPKEL